MQLVVSFKANKKKHRNEKSALIFFLAGRSKVLVSVAAETRKGTLQDRRLTAVGGRIAYKEKRGAIEQAGSHAHPCRWDPRERPE